MGSQTSRARKTRVQAAPLRESRIEAQEMQEVEPVAQAADEPAQPESDDTEPIDPPVVLRPIRKQYTPLSVSHQLNLPAWS